ncbi:hypothetical protein HDU88_004759 [Geranomyces variabilis]|nr:hypothetical protein HDU88_004759 [Geranomyces variabilis]
MPTSNPDMNATQLNIHENVSVGENVAVERRLEEGTWSRESSLATLGPARGNESIVTCQQRLRVLNQFTHLAGWLIIFTGSAILSLEVRVDGFSPAWFPTGILAAALVKSTVRTKIYLSLLLFPAMVGTACLEFPLPIALYFSAILYVSAALLATVLKRLCPEVAYGLETTSSCISFLATAPISAFVDGLGFARALGTMPDYFETNFIILALRSFISSLVGVVYGSTMYFMLPVGVAAGFTAGIPGMSSAIALGFASVAFVSVRYRPAHENSSADAVLHLQLWTIVLICATLLLTAGRLELRVCRYALDNLKRGINRNANQSVKQANLCAPSESPYILRYVCRQLEKSLQRILRDCRLITGDARRKNFCHDPALTQASADVAERTVNLITVYMLPLIADANRLARMADGREDQLLTSVDLPAFLEELSAQLRVELADADIETRFNLPDKFTANVDEERIKKIFRAMVIDACRHKTREGRVCIQAIVSSRDARSIKGDEYVDLDITVTVIGWVVEQHHIDLLIRPYMPSTDLSTQDVDLSGTDLGLAVASHLALSLNGRLIVFGQHGYGTIFECRLPTKAIIENSSASECFLTSEKKRDERPKELGVAAKAPMLKQLSDTANSAALLPRTIGNRFKQINSHRGSKDSDASWESGQLRQTVNMKETSNIVGSSRRFSGARTVRKSVLVVDDSRLNRRLLHRMLQQYPELQIDEASDGLEAFEACIATPYSLILMDFIMGEMDGCECTRRLRYEGISVPIVLTTANLERAEAFKRFGLDDVLVKPITKQSLATVLLKFEIIPTGHPSLPREDNVIVLVPSYGLAPILIVDDNPISCRVLREQLRRIIPTREVMQASDGTEAVALCSAGQKFAIIYMDLAMPGMDGDVAATQIRNMRAIGGGPPIIAVTGQMLDGESFQGLRASGINDAIAKPVCQESLIGTLYSFGILDSASLNPSPETGPTPDLDFIKKQ